MQEVTGGGNIQLIQLVDGVLSCWGEIFLANFILSFSGPQPPQLTLKKKKKSNVSLKQGLLVPLFWI